MGQWLLNERDLILDEELTELVLQKGHELGEGLLARGQKFATLGPKHVDYLVPQCALVVGYYYELVLSLGDLDDTFIYISIDDDRLPPQYFPLGFYELGARDVHGG